MSVATHRPRRREVSFEPLRLDPSTLPAQVRADRGSRGFGMLVAPSAAQ